MSLALTCSGVVSSRGVAAGELGVGGDAVRMRLRGLLPPGDFRRLRQTGGGGGGGAISLRDAGAASTFCKGRVAYLRSHSRSCASSSELSRLSCDACLSVAAGNPSSTAVSSMADETRPGMYP